MRRVAAAAAALILLAGGLLIAVPSLPQLRLTIHVRSAAGVYAGSDVRVLGVRVGRVESVTPEGATVRVELTYDQRHPAPAAAVAVVVQPTLVGERYVQLAPAYRGGPVLADGADLPVTRTATPAEPDDILRALDDLGTALGPAGSGASGRLVTTGRRNLEGNGAALNRAITDVAALARTSADGSADTAATIRDLEAITAALAASDGRIRDFAGDLAAVGAQLDGEKDDLAAALRTLTDALAQLAGFVRENGATLSADVRGLTELSALLVRQRDALATVLDAAPVALAELERAYDPATGALTVRDSGRDCAHGTCRPAPAPPRRSAAAADPEPTLDRTLGGILKAAR